MSESDEMQRIIADFEAEHSLEYLQGSFATLSSFGMAVYSYQQENKITVDEVLTLIAELLEDLELMINRKGEPDNGSKHNVH